MTRYGMTLDDVRVRDEVPWRRGPERIAAPARRLSGWRYTPLVIHGWFFVLVLCLWIFGVTPENLLYISGGVATVVYAVLAVIEVRRAPLLVSPLSALFVWYFPPTGPSAIHFANRIADGEPILYSVRVLHPDDIAAGYVLQVLGNLAIHAGLQWTRPWVGPDTAPPKIERPRLDGLLIIWLASIYIRFSPNAISSLGAIAGILHFGSTTALAAYLLSRYRHERTWFFWLTVVGGTVLEFVTNLNTGSKAYLMFSFLPILWLFLRDQKLRRFVPVLSVGMFMLYVGVIAPVVMASRMGPADQRESAMNRIMRTYSRGEYQDDAGAEKQLPRYLERAFDTTATACIYGEVDRTGFMYGEGMSYLIYALVPRVIWPEKPIMTRGAWFTEYLGQATSEESATTSLGQTAPGELYWNFGWSGVVIGMILIGAMMGKLWAFATPHAERNSLRLLLYFGLTFQITNMAEAGSAILSLVFRAIIIGAVIWVVDRVWGMRYVQHVAYPLPR